MVATCLLNIYRMLRSTRDLSDASRFLGTETSPGEFQAVDVLLGLLTSDARMLAQVLDTAPQAQVAPPSLGGLMHRAGAERWAFFLTGMSPRPWAAGEGNDVAGALSAAEAARWRRLVAELSPVTGLVTLPDLTAFQLWAPRSRRFSFVLSPLGASPGAAARSG